MSTAALARLHQSLDDIRQRLGAGELDEIPALLELHDQALRQQLQASPPTAADQAGWRQLLASQQAIGRELTEARDHAGAILVRLGQSQRAAHAYATLG